ncbi:NUDIX domain-containing protein [Kitasatospora purpeofusca]|uniref:NUDIX domain-containing protein n=1 Tax=Kitasatospora purpeofusca TaxID=67352 RepID=UPI00386AB093|nr:NUDIX domain-containing protein [Kitasatospora purpeofusca]
MTEWTVHGRRQVYGSPWVELWLDDVDIPGVGRVDHHVLRMPKECAVAVVTDAEGRYLVLHRHRFITDRWAWELPAGWVEPGEEPAAAAAREVEEETGWRPGAVEPLTEFDAMSGISTMHFHAFHATGATPTGGPVDRSEASRVEWLTEREVVGLLTAGEVADGASLAALSYFLGPHRLAAGGTGGGTGPGGK